MTPLEIKERNRIYRGRFQKKHPEKAGEYRARYYLKHREQELLRRKKYLKDNKNKVNAYRKIWRSQNRDKTRAHRMVEKAVKEGILIRRPCHCGATPTEAHHPNYKQPLRVLWLCIHHHQQAHGKRIYGFR